MDDAETTAKLVLEAILHGSKLEYHSIQSNGEYDFVLRYDNGTSAAVEVTSAVDRDRVQTAAAIRDKRKGGSGIQATACKKSWYIFPANVARINDIRTNADNYLSKLEQEGIENFSWLSRDPKCVEDICCDLDIMSGSVISAGARPTIRIKFPVYGSAVGQSTATDAAEAEAWKSDNRRKLGAAHTIERHIVIYVDALNGSPWIALTSFTPPSILPKLPAEITNIWLMGSTGNANEFIAWYANTNESWRGTTVTCPSEALEQLGRV